MNALRQNLTRANPQADPTPAWEREKTSLFLRRQEAKNGKTNREKHNLRTLKRAARGYGAPRGGAAGIASTRG